MKEEEIRPKKIFDEFLCLAKQDSEIYFGGVKRVSKPCPACNCEGDFAFEKFGFSYEVCDSCQTLFANPRPVSSAFNTYYTESSSSKFWGSTFYKETEDARREKLWKPKAQLLADALERYGCSDHAVIDIGGGFGLFAEEFRAHTGKAPLVIEPGPELASICRDRSLSVVEKFLEDVDSIDLPPGSKAFVSFELFEHLHDAEAFLNQLMSLMSSGDLFVFTTLSGAGVDIQALWEDSKSVMPPYHLNFFNPRSIHILLDRLGFQCLSVTTPGRLDLDILDNNREAIKDRFWRTFISTASDVEKQEWQALIAASGWSSHMMVICRKP